MASIRTSTIMMEDPKIGEQWRILDDLYVALIQLKTLITIRASSKDKSSETSLESECITILTKLAIINIIQKLMKLPYPDGLDCLEPYQIDKKSLLEWLNTDLIPYSQQLAKECKEFFKDSSLKSIRLPEMKISEVDDSHLSVAFSEVIALSSGIAMTSIPVIITAAKVDHDFISVTNELLNVFNFLYHTIYANKRQTMAKRIAGLNRDEEAIAGKIKQLEEEMKKKTEMKSTRGGVYDDLNVLIKNIKAYKSSVDAIFDDIRKKIPSPFTTTANESRYKDATAKSKLTTSFSSGEKFKTVNSRIEVIKNELISICNQITDLINYLKEEEIIKKSKYDPEWIKRLTTVKAALETEIEKLELLMKNNSELKSSVRESIQKSTQHQTDVLEETRSQLSKLVTFKKLLETDEHAIVSHPASKLVTRKIKSSDLTVFGEVSSGLSKHIFRKELKEHKDIFAVTDSAIYTDLAEENIIRLTAITNFGSFLLYQLSSSVVDKYPLMSGLDQRVIPALTIVSTSPVVIKTISEYLAENMLEALRHYSMHSVDTRSSFEMILSDEARVELRNTTRYLRDLVSAYLEGSSMPMNITKLTETALKWNRMDNGVGEPDELLGIAHDIITRLKREINDYVKLEKKQVLFSPFPISDLADIILERRIANEKEAKIALKFDGLLQSLGEIFNSLAKVAKTNYENVLEKVAPLMLYRNNKTHSGISDKDLIIHCLNTVQCPNVTLLLLNNTKKLRGE